MGSTAPFDHPAKDLAKDLKPIPAGPPPLPFIGNLRDLTGESSAPQNIPGHPDSGLHVHIARLVGEYGPFFTLDIPTGLLGAPTRVLGDTTAVCCDPVLLEELFNRPEVFAKRLFKYSPIRKGVAGQGLFTCDDDEPIHDVAANILLPAFSMAGMKEYFGMIGDCNVTLLDQLEKRAADIGGVDLHPLLSSYTFDVIGKVGFGVDFQSMTQKADFLELFTEFSEISNRMKSGIGASFNATKILKAIVSGNAGAFAKCQARIRGELTKVVDDKKAAVAKQQATGCPFAGVSDMATRMLTVADPVSGEKLDDENILSQVATFLVAGHDSTSTAITMLLYQVAMHPEVEERVYQEVMAVAGDGPITFDMLGKMKYITQVVKENLRLFPPAPHFLKTSPPDQVVSLGGYEIPKGTTFIMSTWGLHKNPAVYPDPEKFDPDRFSDENSKARSPYAWLPFSYGKRACIGQQLSLIEQRMVLAEVCRKFHIRVDPSTKLSVTTPLFLDPQGVHLRATRRAPGAAAPATFVPIPAEVPAGEGQIGHLEQLAGKHVFVLYGSNMGTCEELADKVLSSSQAMGMTAQKAPLDQVASGLKLPKGDDGLVVLITSTYNGRPPNNALKFDAWLDTPAAADALKGVRFAIYGCGNKQWAATYMKFPRRIQECFEQFSAEPLVAMGEGDMDGGEVELSFARWDVSTKIAILQAYNIPIPETIKELMYPKPLVYDTMLCMGKKVGENTRSTRTALVAEGAQRARDLFMKDAKGFRGEVTVNRELVDMKDRSTRHIEVKLPADVSYTAGDHLGVLGANPDSVVFAYMDHLGLAHDALIRLELAPGTTHSLSHMPLNQPIGAFAVLAMGFELQQPATRNQLRALAKYARCPPEADHLRRLSEFGQGNCGESCGDRQDAYESEVLSQRRTVLEILQEHRSVDIPLGALLGLLPPMKPRYYSISSSSKKLEDRLSISVSVVQGSAPTGRQHLGLCSNYLKSQPHKWPRSVKSEEEAGEWGTMPLYVFVKDTGSSFRLPKDDLPIIMVGPGTGVAPMRGFIEDRVADGRKENYLFFGCRDTSDYIYKEELEQYEQSGFLKLFVAFSRKAGSPKTYVQHQIAQQAHIIVDVIKRGGYFYVCGDASKMAPDVKATVTRILADAGMDAGYVERMVEEGRYCEDVWAAQSL